ncbi:hypothetical protein EXE10_13280 [Acinetobacter sp. WCHAc060033]|uniref:hypothetical protein n=1 Tax=Acinetobacter sp. WCHAc060033 TaxID=2518624 RepID=UPI001022E806|nr:hypothetical protein [Acinetobacter sp. WCHAc060033]RZG81271.1 hypothetical protein EXE10_13280 [Acinetobacter sp. WCHAc060033]
MKAMTKIALVSASVLAMGALTACQSNPSPKEGHDGRGMMHGDKHHRMSPEQREQMKQMRAERHEFKKLAQTACDNKAVGSTVSFKVNEKSVEGTCAINFHPDRGAMKALRDTDRVKDHDNRHDRHRFKRGQELTAEQKAQFEQQRAERKAQFEQKRAERQAKWDAIQSACNGQTNGKQIQAKIDDKLIAGTCVVHFKPNTRPDMMGKPMHAPAPVDAPVPPKA